MEFEKEKKTSSDTPARRTPGKHVAQKVKAQKPARRPSREKKASGKGFALTGKKKTVLMVALICVTVLFALSAVGMIYVNASDSIFPKVSVDGVDVGGKSETEALYILSEELDDRDEQVQVTVSLPLGYDLTVSGDEAGLAVTAADRAQLAVEACRGGNPFTNAFTYLKCMLFGMELNSASDVKLDETSIRAKIDNMAHEVRIGLMSSDLEIGEDSISVIKGASGVTIDTDEIYSLIETAFKEHKYETIVYEPQISTTQEIDLQGIYDTVYCEPQNASYDKETDSIISHVVGMSFDIDAAREIWSAAEYGDKVVIPLVTRQPEITSEYLEGVLFSDCLSAKATSLSGSSSNRINNITLAAQTVNGLILLPGEEFNYNSVVGERTAARGYLTAGAYSNGQNVQEYGGGICQVSSTIYYCTLYANLKITSRTCHMFPVSYLPPGLDATVSWGGPEFKFVNNRDYPIKIYAWVDTSSNTLNVELWGTDVDGSYVEMTYSTAYVFHDTYQDIAIGYKAWSYRHVYDKNGNLLSKELEASSYYSYHTEDLNFPTESPEVSESPDVSEDLDVSGSPDVSEDPGAEVSAPAGGVSPDPGESEVPASASPDETGGEAGDQRTEVPEITDPVGEGE